MIAVRIDRRFAARVDPSDVLQDAMMEAYRRLHEYLDNRAVPFYPWLRKIAWECLVDLYHRHVTAKKRTVNKEQPISFQLTDQSTMDLGRIVAQGARSPSEHAIREEMQSRMGDAIERLDDTDREVLVLRHLEQLSVSEVATVLGVSQGAVKMRRLPAMTDR